MIKRFLIALVLVALVCGGIVGFNLFRDNAIKEYFASRQQPALVVSTVTAEPQTWQPGIEAIGTVGAARGVDVAVETGGIVKSVDFEANDDVEDGALLVQIDDVAERADLKAAMSSLKLKRETLERTKTLSSRGVSTSSNLDTAEEAVTSAEATVERLKAVLEQKRIDAPFSGTIGIPKVEVGQYVTAGSAVATLQNLDTMRVDFSVPEQKLADLRIGQSVDVGLSEDDLRFGGRISGIEPKIDPTSRLVTVRARVESAAGTLQPGQFARVRVSLPAEKGVIAIPQTALTTSLYGDYVFVVRSKTADGSGEGASGDEPAISSSEDGSNRETEAVGEARAAETGAEDPEKEAGGDQDGDGKSGDGLVAEQVFVKIGRRAGRLVEITDGVKAGDRVITAGQNRISNGAAVTIDNAVNPAGNVDQAETAG